MAGALSWPYAEPLAEVIYRKLSQDIGDGVYEPGTRLVQDQVAEELGVSRTPVQPTFWRCSPGASARPDRPGSHWLATSAMSPGRGQRKQSAAPEPNSIPARYLRADGRMLMSLLAAHKHAGDQLTDFGKSERRRPR